MTVVEMPLADELIATGSQSSSVMYKLVKLCAAFERSTEWAFAGLPTAAHWIAMNLDVEVCTAREWIRIGKALERLPICDEAFRSQRLSYSKIRALTRVAKPETEAELATMAENIPAGRLNSALAAWSLRNEDAKEIDERHRRQRGMFVSTQPDGAIFAVLRLTPLAGGKLLAAVDAKVMAKPHASADASSLAQQRADALVSLVTEGPAKVETEIIVHVRADGCSFDDGTPIAGSIVEKLAPKAFIRALIHDAQSQPINASGRQRHPTTRQKRVVKERDRHCVDCGSSDFEQYDHVPAFEITHHTVIDELQLRCSRCHAKRHQDDTGAH